MKRTRNIFVSHLHEDDDHIRGMKSLLAKRDLHVKDSSVNSSNPNKAKNDAYIKSMLAWRINWAGAVVVLISPGTKNSRWVDWEIEYAHQRGKPIVGVWTSGSAECDLPEPLERYADAVVGWNGERIERALDGEITNWEKSDGEILDAREVPRYSC